MPKILTVYFSRKGENYWNGRIVNLKKGNTEIAAEFIRDAVGGDLFEVESLKEYPQDYHECTEVARDELKRGERVAVKAFPENLEDYPVIFVGYPNWWGTMPMALFTFLEHYDLKGKTVIPLCTNEGSGMGHSERDLKKICTGARVLPGLAVRGSAVTESRGEIVSWAQKSLEL